MLQRPTAVRVDGKRSSCWSEGDIISLIGGASESVMAAHAVLWFVRASVPRDFKGKCSAQQLTAAGRSTEVVDPVNEEARK